jgi:hypothetical protein
MRNVFIAAVAITMFGLGAWASPTLTAQTQGAQLMPPVFPATGDKVTFLGPPNSSVDCDVTRAFEGWVRCGDSEWRNLTTGIGFSLTRKPR